MQLVFVKMKNGEELLGYLGNKTDNAIEIVTPICISIDPTLGIFAKSWLIFSDLNSAWITDSDYMFFSAASRKATEYYDEFMHNMAEKEQRRNLQEDTEFTNELEELFSAMIDSKGNTKH